jgi:hypothetical protein
MTLLLALALCLVFLWSLKLFVTGEGPVLLRPLPGTPARERTPEQVRSSGIVGMLLAIVGLAVLAAVTFG